MIELITLDEYYNRIGRELFDQEWTGNEIKYHLGLASRKKYKKLEDRAKEAMKLARSRIWADGSPKICYKPQQGYINPYFEIWDFNFPRSMCCDYEGNYIKCKLELKKKDNRGAPNKFAKIVKPLIHECVQKLYIDANIPTEEISGDSVIRYVKGALEKKKASRIPSDNTIRKYLHGLYDECKKTSRNSKK